MDNPFVKVEAFASHDPHRAELDIEIQVEYPFRADEYAARPDELKKARRKIPMQLFVNDGDIMLKYVFRELRNAIKKEFRNV